MNWADKVLSQSINSNSIYIGVNDTWHEILYNNGVATPKFERLYDIMLSDIYEALPDIKLILRRKIMAGKKAKTKREKIILECTECKRENYRTEKNRKNTTDRLELKKYWKNNFFDD